MDGDPVLVFDQEERLRGPDALDTRHAVGSLAGCQDAPAKQVIEDPCLRQDDAHRHRRREHQTEGEERTASQRRK